MVPMNTWKRAKLTKRNKNLYEKQHSGNHTIARETRTTNRPELTGRGNRKTNTLHNDKPQIQKHSTQGANNHRVAGKLCVTSTTKGDKNGHMPQTHAQIQTRQIRRNGETGTIRPTCAQTSSSRTRKMDQSTTCTPQKYNKNKHLEKHGAK